MTKHSPSRYQKEKKWDPKQGQNPGEQTWNPVSKKEINIMLLGNSGKSKLSGSKDSKFPRSPLFIGFSQIWGCKKKRTHQKQKSVEMTRILRNKAITLAN